MVPLLEVRGPVQLREGASDMFQILVPTFGKAPSFGHDPAISSHGVRGLSGGIWMHADLYLHVCMLISSEYVYLEYVYGT